MNYLTSLLFLLAFNVCASTNLEWIKVGPISAVGADAARKYRIAYAECSYLGTNFTATLCASNLDAAPTWKGDVAPPLLPNDAISNALKYLSNSMAIPLEWQYRESDAWKPANLALVRCHQTDYWYYELKLCPHLANYNTPRVTVFVSMSGYVSPLVMNTNIILEADRKTRSPNKNDIK